MLPLWIIDITNQSKRQGAFKHLVGRIGHVYTSPEPLRVDIQPEGQIVETSPSDEEQAIDNEAVAENGNVQEQNTQKPNQEVIMAEKESVSEKDLSDKFTTKEIIEEQEKRAAERNALVEGDYWYYSSIVDCFQDVDKSVPEEVAKRLYAFQSALVEEGQRFIKRIRQSNVKPYQTINIIVLGDTTEEMTRTVFPSIAAILQKEKGRFLPNHIHQGMEIMGMLFVPCDINARKVEERNLIQQTLKEIHVQYLIPSMRGYDHMLLYQDVQNRTECNYSLLDPQGQAEYLLQCLVHLFLACDKTHPLISGTGSADDFYISMGAASVYFDMSVEDAKERIRIENEIIKSFKDKGDFEKDQPAEPLITKLEYTPSNYFQKFTPNEIDLEDVDPDEPKLHPVKDFLAKHLKRYYYNMYLRFFPAEFYHKIVAKVEENTKDYLEKIAEDSRRKYHDSENRLRHLVKQKFTTINANNGGLPNFVTSLKEVQATLSGNRTEIRPYLNFVYWPKIENSLHKSQLEDPFMDYHDTYLQDLNAKNEGSGCETMKNEAKNELHDLLSKETTILGAIGRCFMGGILCVLALFPLLVFLSHTVINLGDVQKYWYIWKPCLFLIPTLIFLIQRWFYHRKKRRKLLILKAYYLHDAYARIANRIDSEINGFYDKMIALCDAYLTRCETIRKEILTQSPDDLVGESEIPETKFNQPLAGGDFGKIQLLPSEKHDDSQIKVNYVPKTVLDLKKSDYYLLINQFHNDFELLFDGIYLTMNFMLRQNPETGEDELVTKAQQEEEIAKKWEENKAKFREELRDSVRSVMIPRQNATVSDKLIAYMRNTGRNDVLEPMIEFAACNGEITSTADTEYADIKANREDIQEYCRMFLPEANTKYQIEKYDAFYKKYIFVTRWRSFNHFSFNRILPTEDFDAAVHERLVSNYGKSQVQPSEEGENHIPERLISTISLWALCPEDNSTEWFTTEWLKLIGAENYQEARKMMVIYRDILNQND